MCVCVCVCVCVYCCDLVLPLGVWIPQVEDVVSEIVQNPVAVPRHPSSSRTSFPGLFGSHNTMINYNRSSDRKGFDFN